MAAGDLFKRTLDAGSSLYGMTRERAESVVREWVDSGDLRKARAQKAIDDLMARSRRMTEELREMIRREIAEQVSTLGFATKEDLAELEGRLALVRAGDPGGPGPERPRRAGGTGPERPRRAGDTGPERPRRAGDTGPSPTPGKRSQAPREAPVKKEGPTRKAAAPKKVGAKKVGARKVAAKKVPAKKVPAKKAPPKKVGAAEEAGAG